MIAGILSLRPLSHLYKLAMTITEGLFKLDVTDHHAVLGFSLAADPKQVRKRYLKVARQLHPDSLREMPEAQRQLASELLSKRVNPAYEALTQEKLMTEHYILLKMKQQQLIARPILFTAKCEAAKRLLGTGNLEADYTAALRKIADTQFADLAQVDTAIGEISELNAVYLTRKGNIGEKTTRSAIADTAPADPVDTPRRPRHEAIIESYLSRAKEFDYKRDYSRAILELREAIAAHPQSALCHGYLSSLYLKAGQATLAKIHAKQALTFDPDNDLAKAVQTQLGAKSAKPASAAKEARGGGLLSGLFGGKKA